MSRAGADRAAQAVRLARSAAAGGPRRLVLASASPRRRELLLEAGFRFEVIPAKVEEPEGATMCVGPAVFAEAVSLLKARAVADALGRGGQSRATVRCRPPLPYPGHRCATSRAGGRVSDRGRVVAHGCSDGAVVLGADTVVALDGCLYGKPRDAGDARRILGVLMHRPHEVITGVTLIDTETQRRTIAHAVTRVTMRPMSAAELEAYIAGGLWAGKAGAYGIQDHDDKFVRRVEGSFSNVVGLPMELVVELLRGCGGVGE